MARYDKDTDIQINPPLTEKHHADKPKGEMSVRDAAAMEMGMSQQTVETGMRGAPVHGFGNGTETTKRHTGMGMDTMSMGPIGMGAPQQSTGESLTEVVEHIFHLPFQAQLGLMRMIAPRILGAMDARDQESFLNDLRSELSTMAGEESTHAPPMNTQDLQDT
ncbi:hypothetical protein JQX13_00480 [Archangium violaceum]|uniref:hypothetical protein n=1 Tax=Archangium violaceum TaxID=83451 RepID=UPI00193B2180|nr:hypothetical protein [Archangium violaceum]QRK08702.1 hypothetical protein JQX13_00480 [Archangium violaceum]